MRDPLLRCVDAATALCVGTNISSTNDTVSNRAEPLDNAEVLVLA